MNKHLTRGLIIFLSVLFMATFAYADNAAYWVDAEGTVVENLQLADGGDANITLMAEVPEGKTLNAYSFVVMYDEKRLDVDAVAADSAIVAENVNVDTPGEVVANAFSVDGVAGGAPVALLNVNVKMSAAHGASQIHVLFTAFGSSSENQFKPKVSPFKVTAK